MKFPKNDRFQSVIMWNNYPALIQYHTILFTISIHTFQILIQFFSNLLQFFIVIINFPSGTLDNTSATLFFDPGRKHISKSYPMSLDNHCCCSGVSIVWLVSSRKAFWSVIILNRLPTKYCFHLLTAYVIANISRW